MATAHAAPAAGAHAATATPPPAAHPARTGPSFGARFFGWWDRFAHRHPVLTTGTLSVGMMAAGLEAPFLWATLAIALGIFYRRELWAWGRHHPARAVTALAVVMLWAGPSWTATWLVVGFAIKLSLWKHSKLAVIFLETLIIVWLFPDGTVGRLLRFAHMPGVATSFLAEAQQAQAQLGPLIDRGFDCVRGWAVEASHYAKVGVRWGVFQAFHLIGVIWDHRPWR